MLVTMPLAFAFFLAVVVHPVERALAARLPARLQGLAVLLAMLLIVGAGAAAIAVISLALLPVTERAPDYVDRLQEQLEAWRGWAGATASPAGGLRSRRHRDERRRQSVVWGLTSAGEVAGVPAPGLLLHAADARRGVRLAPQDPGGARAAATRRRCSRRFAEVAHKVRRFVLVRSFVSLIAAFAQGGWLWLMGVDFAPFWAVLIFFFNYLPNVGSIVVGHARDALAFVQFGPGWAAVVAVGPDRHRPGASATSSIRSCRAASSTSPRLVVLVAVIFWGWMWGVGGALLAVPLTVTIILVCARVPALRADRDAAQRRPREGRGRAGLSAPAAGRSRPFLRRRARS